MGCYVSSYRHAIPSLPLYIFGGNRVLKHPSLLPQVPCFLTFFDVCATLTCIETILTLACIETVP